HEEILAADPIEHELRLCLRVIGRFGNRQDEGKIHTVRALDGNYRLIRLFREGVLPGGQHRTPHEEIERHTGGDAILGTRATGAALPSSGRVLVVEDDPAIRELLRMHLSLARFDIVETSDGRVALERARATRFDVIVLDVMLPGIDGVTLCRALRADGPNTGT